MNIEQKGSYLSHIEGLRAFAALMVMCFHFITFNTTHGYVVQNEQLREYSGFGAQGVELFYIISGCVIAISFRSTSYTFLDFPRYVLKRILRIIPSYYAVIILICLLALVWGGFPYTEKELLLNATFTVDLFPDQQWLNPIFSTLKVEFQFYIIIGLLYPWLKKYNVISFVLVPAVYTAAFFYPEIEILRNAPYFILGLLAAEVLMRPEHKWNGLYIALCIAGMAFDYHPEEFAIVGIALLFLLVIKLQSRWLEYVGKFSYSLYLVHGLIGGTFLELFTQDKYFHLQPAIAITCAAVFSVIGAWLFYLIIEKRSLRWTKLVRYKR